MNKRFLLFCILLLHVFAMHVFAQGAQPSSPDFMRKDSVISDITKRAVSAANEQVLTNSIVAPMSAAAPGDVMYGTYKWTENIPMVKCDFAGRLFAADSADTIVQSKIGQKFLIYNTSSNGDIIIKVITYLKKTANFYSYNFSGNEDEYREVYVKGAESGSNNSKKRDNGDYGSKQRYFRVRATDILKYAIEASVVKGGLAAGVVNYPFKFRPQAGMQDFTNSFNLSIATGYTFSHKSEANWTWTIVGAFGISNIGLDTSVVNKGKADLQAGNSYSAITFSVGGMVQYQKVQVGVFIGMDRLTYLFQQQFGWKYQGNLWGSLGMGFAIFSPQKSEPSTAQKE